MFITTRKKGTNEMKICEIREYSIQRETSSENMLEYNLKKRIVRVCDGMCEKGYSDSIFPKLAFTRTQRNTIRIDMFEY